MLPRRLHGTRSSRPGAEPRTTTYRTAQSPALRRRQG